jgi:hypothetical protein
MIPVSRQCVQPAGIIDPGYNDVIPFSVMLSLSKHL